MSGLLVDTSVLVKWFETRGEDELDPARAIRSAHVQDRLTVWLLDLALYELGNVLLRRRTWSADEIADQVDDLIALIGPPVALGPLQLRDGGTAPFFRRGCGRSDKEG